MFFVFVFKLVFLAVNQKAAKFFKEKLHNGSASAFEAESKSSILFPSTKSPSDKSTVKSGHRLWLLIGVEPPRSN